MPFNISLRDFVLGMLFAWVVLPFLLGIVQKNRSPRPA